MQRLMRSCIIRSIHKSFYGFHPASQCLCLQSLSGIGAPRWDDQHRPKEFNFEKDMLDYWAQMEKEGKRKSSPAMWVNNEGKEIKWTFVELAEMTRRAANVFTQTCGLRQGDRLALILPRVPEWWLVAVGCIRSGKSGGISAKSQIIMRLVSVCLVLWPCWRAAHGGQLVTSFGHEGLPNGFLHVFYPSAKDNSFSFNFVKILHENFDLGIICFAIRKLAISGLLLGVFALIADISQMNPPGNLEDYEVRLQKLSEKINSVMKQNPDSSEIITTREHQLDDSQENIKETSEGIEILFQEKQKYEAKIRTLEDSCNRLILLNKSKKEELNQLIQNNNMNTMANFNYQEETVKINVKLKEIQQESGLLEEQLSKAEEILKLVTSERDLFKQQTENMKEKLKQIENSFQKQITTLKAATDANRRKDFKMNWDLAQKIRELDDLKRRLDIEQEMRRREEFRRQMAQRPRMKTFPKTKTVRFLEAAGSGTSNQPNDTKKQKQDTSIAATPQPQHEPVTRPDSMEQRNSINVDTATSALPPHGNFQGPILSLPPQSSDISIEMPVTPCLSSGPDPAVPIADTINSPMTKDNEHEEDMDEETNSRASSPWTGPFSSGYVGQHFTRAMCFVNDRSKINRRPLQNKSIH